jgi:GNAT superfamily N-acetyltransferase
MPLTSSAEFYRAVFARQCASRATSEHTMVDQPGICGVLGTPQRPDGRLLITDDRGLPVVEGLARGMHVRFVAAFDAAEKSREYLQSLDRWRFTTVTAMVCPDLALVPAAAAVDGLTVRPVRRAPDDPDDWVPLEQALRACMEADPAAADVDLNTAVTIFQSLPGVTRLFAAVDPTSTVRATAGSSVFGPDAAAFFVSTHQRWRNRGVATAMTAIALAWARETGAQGASLDATPAGRSIYTRLGFETVTPTTVFTPPE